MYVTNQEIGGSFLTYLNISMDDTIRMQKR